MGIFNWNNEKNVIVDEKLENVTHLKNLLIIAGADGVLHPLEFEIITAVMQRLKLDESDFADLMIDLLADNIISNENGGFLSVTSNIKEYNPKDRGKAFHFMTDTVIVSIVDGNISNKEKSICYEIARQLGFSSTVVDVQILNMTAKLKGVSIKEMVETKSQNTLAMFNPKDSNTDHFFSAIETAVNCLNNHKKLSRHGEVEALIFFTLMLTELRTDYDNNLDMCFADDRIFLRLHNSIIKKVDGLNVINFINSRIGFYSSEIARIQKENLYSPMFIYNCIYINPLINDPKDFNGKSPMSPTELLIFQKMYEKIVEIINEQLNI